MPSRASPARFQVGAFDVQCLFAPAGRWACSSSSPPCAATVRGSASWGLASVDVMLVERNRAIQGEDPTHVPGVAPLTRAQPAGGCGCPLAHSPIKKQKTRKVLRAPLVSHRHHCHFCGFPLPFAFYQPNRWVGGGGGGGGGGSCLLKSNEGPALSGGGGQQRGHTSEHCSLLPLLFIDLDVRAGGWAGGGTGRWAGWWASVWACPEGGGLACPREAGQRLLLLHLSSRRPSRLRRLRPQQERHPALVRWRGGRRRCGALLEMLLCFARCAGRRCRRWVVPLLPAAPALLPVLDGPYLTRGVLSTPSSCRWIWAYWANPFAWVTRALVRGSACSASPRRQAGLAGHAAFDRWWRAGARACRPAVIFPLRFPLRQAINEFTAGQWMKPDPSNPSTTLPLGIEVLVFRWAAGLLGRSRCSVLWQLQ